MNLRDESFRFLYAARAQNRMDDSALTPFVSIPALAAAFRRAENRAPYAGLEGALGMVAHNSTSHSSASHSSHTHGARETGLGGMNGNGGLAVDKTGVDKTGVRQMSVRNKGAAALVPMYQVSPTSPEPAAEAAAAAQVIVAVADRLRRLAAAYSEWTDFDAEAYFDLTPAQTALLLDLTERVTSVHLSFFIDPLLPSFQEAVNYWQQYFQPHYLQMQHDLDHRQQMPQVSRRVLALAVAGAVEEVDRMGGAESGGHASGADAEAAVDPARRFFQQVQPAMIARWQRLLTVAHHTRRLLADDPAFWALNAANDERLRRRWAWRNKPAAGIGAALLPKLSDVPTLTLSIDFPLPAYRQPGRLRRLRRGRARQMRMQRDR